MRHLFFLAVSLSVVGVDVYIWRKNWEILLLHWKFVAVFTLCCLPLTLIDSVGVLSGAWSYSADHTLNLRFLGVEAENFIAFPAACMALCSYTVARIVKDGL